MLHQKLSASLLQTRENYLHKLAQMGLKTVKDLLFYFPRDYRDERAFTPIEGMKVGELNVISGFIRSILNVPTRRGKIMTRAVIQDETGEVSVLWFNQPHLKQMFHKGSAIILTGKPAIEKGRFVMMSPKYERPAKELLHTGRIVPVYPESDIITSQWLRTKIHALLPHAEHVTDPLPEEVRLAENLIPLGEAIYHVHFAEDEECLKRARERLAFDELLFIQLFTLRKKLVWRAQQQHEASSPKKPDLQTFFDSLPYTLTGAQSRVIEEILTDFLNPYPMLRLLQGDVGSGKTVVAAAAIFANYQAGQQSALMAPTEILARQHYKGLVKLFAPLGINVQLLTGSTTEKERRSLSEQVAMGICHVVIGTHALLYENLQFSRLGLVVIDEQHRFGVAQREALRKHGSPHILNLTATPIPRTMALTLYGDQELSILDELPPGRQTIITRIVPEEKRQDAYRWIEDQVQKGRQVYIICPLVEESEVLELKAATVEFERLKNEVFPNLKLALLHGRMKAAEKDAIMKAFSAGEVDILVSTSVVEVGIDVPNATIMLIEAAERFGLAQLHQFRGRVGRGEHQSYCFLFPEKASGEAMQRLKAMEQHHSGFDLAEIDLKLRGPGEILGTRQSGFPDLKVAHFADIELLQRVRHQAEQLLAKDPELKLYPLLKQELEQFIDEDTFLG